MSIIQRALKKKAVYWAPTGSDKFGKTTFADPVEIDCRWDEDAKLFLTEEGKQEVSRALVMVSVDTQRRGMLKLGTLDDLVANPSTPYQNAEVYEIRGFKKLRKLSREEYFRQAIL